ncbi:polyprenyl synthetase family protein [Streptomyces sp. NPDC008150]|uniref:polyprenyl synthetase family protein n=1 Tax=Streptomyces sp. NPDC008150 TaxID=3364816 RepID=UPI0036EEDC1A
MHSMQARDHLSGEPAPGPCGAFARASSAPLDVRDSAAAPHAWDTAPDTAPRERDTPAPRDVDRDVPGAVEHLLRRLLGERLAEASALDPGFARDLADRTARFTLRGGRRLRPQFVWWALRCAGEPDADRVETALRIGAALELIQTCALVHDDVMDDAPLRRGRPALHAAVTAQYDATASPGRAGPLGVAAAILAGDLALVWADDVVAANTLPPDTDRRVRRLWAAMRTEMVAGQYLDVHGQATASRSASGALRAARLKSALYSVERPLALGAALAGTGPAATEALCAAGRHVGLAFQLRDDLDDVFGDPGRTGKPSGGDLREGKPTLLLAVARARAAETGDRHALGVLDDLVGRADLADAGLDRVRDVFEATGAHAAVEERIGLLLARGLRRLDAARPAPEAHRRLRALMGAVAAPAASAPGTPHPTGAPPGPPHDDARPRSGATGGPAPAPAPVPPAPCASGAGPETTSR